jgi:hypothetical protein
MGFGAGRACRIQLPEFSSLANEDQAAGHRPIKGGGVKSLSRKVWDRQVRISFFYAKFPNIFF